MSKAGRELVNTWQYLRHYQAAETTDIAIASDHRAQKRQGAQVIAILAISAIGFVIALKWWPFPSNLALLLMGMIVSALTLHRCLEQQTSKAYLRLGRESLTLVGAGWDGSAIGYEEIAKIGFPQEEGKWLSLTLRDGRTISVPHTGDKERRRTDEKSVVTLLHPILGSRIGWERNTCPEDPLKALAYIHFYRIPDVELKPGVTYRYAYPKGLREAIGNRIIGIGDVLFILLVSNFRERMWLALVCLTLAYLAFRLRTFIPVEILSRALRDRITLTPQGLTIARKGRTWTVPYSRTTGYCKDGPSILDGQAHRYGRGRSLYYLDARFLEEEP